jgi:epsilon-lactone hydrolase
VSARARLLRAILRLTLRPALTRVHDPKPTRRRFDRLARMLFPPPRGVRVVEAGIGLPGLRLVPPGAGEGVILYLHGGAYLTGSARSHAGLAGALAAASGVQVVLPDYRLAPEDPAPAAFEDALAAWQALRAKGVAPGQIVLGGDSAGGGLALALLAHLCRQGERPAGAVAFSPWTDLTLSGASLRENATRDQYLPAHRMAEARDMVLGGLNPADPRISPLFARFPDPPPVLIHVGESEILRDDALRLAEVLPDADIRLAGDLPHVWPFLHAVLPEGGATLDATAAFIRHCLGSSLTDS